MSHIYLKKVSPCCLTFLLVLSTVNAFSQSTIKGKIVDKNKQPLIGASITVGASQGATTTADGTFTINNLKLPATLKVSFVGYQNKQIKIENAGEINELILTEDTQNLEQVVVSASRKPEKITESPASISVLNARTIKTQPTQGDALNLLKNTQGVRLISNGIAKTNITMRGQALVNETLTLVLKDYRSIANPHTTIIDNERMGVNTLDIERIEVIRGPSGAMWGPGVNAGVVHFLTKDPFAHAGTSANLAYSLEGQDVKKFNFRHAASSGKFGYKVLFSHRSGNDWVYDLSNAEDFTASRLLIETAGPPPLRDGIVSSIIVGTDALTLPKEIAADGKPVYNLFKPFHSNTIEASFEYRPTNDLKFTLAPQWGESLINFRNDGGNTRDWGTIFNMQGRVNYKQFFASLNYFEAFEWSDALHGNNTLGTTLNGNRSMSYISTATDNRGNIKSYDLVTQLPISVNEKLDLVTGFDAKLLRFRGVPVGLENVLVSRHGRNEDDDDFDVYGFYLQGTYKFTNNLKFNAVGRFDNYSVYGSSFSPRLGMVFNPNENKDHAFRASYSQSYRAPSPLVTNFDVVLAGQNVFGARNPMTWNNTFVKYPAGLDKTTATPSISSVLAGVLPNLTATDKAVLAGVTPIGNLTNKIVDPLNGRVFNSISEQYIPKAGLESTTAIELGYSGKSVDRKLQYSLDGFYQVQEGMIVNFTNVGPRVSFPNLKSEVVSALTAKGVSAEVANRVATQAATQYGGNYNAAADQHQTIPFFANNNAPSSGFRNIAGKAKYFGLEGSVQYTTENGINPFFNFSWLSDVVFNPQKLGEPAGSSNAYYLNTSPTRLRFGVNKISTGKGFYGSLAASYDTGYENLTGVWSGTVPSYFMVDASVGYDFGKGLSVDMSATNLTDVLYRPMPYFPAQRRLIFVSITYDLQHNILHKKK